jgi:hypothetical protein
MDVASLSGLTVPLGCMCGRNTVVILVLVNKEHAVRYSRCMSDIRAWSPSRLDIAETRVESGAHNKCSESCHCCAKKSELVSSFFCDARVRLEYLLASKMLTLGL